ncbi:MAG: hypothetical protein JWM16_6440 [Verrucomicrobiales bacterium]|nr:hypothetical protein [Verrucomicrobiales bacterium]
MGKTCANSFSLTLALPLAFACLSLSACRSKDPIYSPNAELIQVMDVQDKKSGPASDKYVLRGGDHLFYLEDLRAAVIKWVHLDSNLRIVGGVSDRLKAKGIRLLVVPVPTKVETYPELLSGRNVFDVSPCKNLFLGGLDSLKVEYLDLRPEFFRVKNEKRLFPHTDTHWDEGAILLAARKIADQLGLHAPSGENLPVTDTTLMRFQGDMAAKFHLAESDTVRLRMVGDGNGGRYAEPDSAGVLLFGDSFLNQYRKYAAHLGAQLARETGAPVKTIYSLTAFTQGPDKINEVVTAFPQAKILIWVFTSRALMESSPL